MSGGFLMVAIGILYLMFEKSLLSRSPGGGASASAAHNTLSRSLIGVQVGGFLSFAFLQQTRPASQANEGQIGFIILAMIVTRSSALSLQAKMGLPRGNQIVGWHVLGMHDVDRRPLPPPD
jgi:phosphatidylinositol glycan class N